MRVFYGDIELGDFHRREEAESLLSFRKQGDFIFVDCGVMRNIDKIELTGLFQDDFLDSKNVKLVSDTAICGDKAIKLTAVVQKKMKERID